MTRSIKIETPRGPVSGLLDKADGPLLILAHGAGNVGMANALFDSFSPALASKGVGCLRFNFLFAELGKKRPDSAATLNDVWLAAFERGKEFSEKPWVGGKSMGGRYSSMLVADGLAAAGVILLGYPLHAVGRTDKLRDEHLPRIKAPTLFVQRTRDNLAKWDLMTKAIGKLGSNVTLHEIAGGDHSFRAKPKRGDDEIGRDLAGVVAEFMTAHS